MVVTKLIASLVVPNIVGRVWAETEYVHGLSLSWVKSGSTVPFPRKKANLPAAFSVKAGVHPSWAQKVFHNIFLSVKLVWKGTGTQY